MVIDMYHPPSKRQQLLRRIAVYGAMTIAIITIVTGLLFYTMGYQFNNSDGKIEQGGLVQFDTKPTGADVMVDYKDVNLRTTNKATLAAGTHMVTMQKDGYRKWSKSVEVLRGSVLWLNYARLVPNRITTSPVLDLTAVTSTVSSPNASYIAIYGDATQPALRVVDITRSPVAATTLVLPSTAYTRKTTDQPETYTVQTWDGTSRYILVRHVYDAKTEWIVVDSRDVSQSKNISTSLNIVADKVVFSRHDSMVLYGLIDGDIRRLNMKDQTMSGPLVRNVADFSLYDKATIAYTTRYDAVTNSRSAGYYTDGATKSHTIGVYTGEQPSLRIAIDKYFDVPYVAVTSDAGLSILSGTLPVSDSSASLSLTTMTSGRFIVSHNESAYTVYDLELAKKTTTRLKNNATITKAPSWIDGYTMYDDASGMLRLYEFDGQNQHDIMQVVPGFTAFLSADSKYLYGITQSADGVYHVSRAQMIL
jgi:uncharacterized ubiquitin-like protein YukD